MQEFIFVALLLALGLGAYYSLVLLPRQRDFVKRQRMVRDLSEGDEVITFGGIIGQVRAIDGEKGIAHVEIADGVIVRMVIAAIVQTYDEEEIARNAHMQPGAAADEPVA